jgi:hypothetical protein
MIQEGWTIALYGANTNKSINTNSCIALANLTNTNPMTDNNWVKIKIKGLSPSKQQLKKKETFTGGISVHRGRRVNAFECEVEYLFPSEMQDYYKLQNVLDHQHIYLFKGDYIFPSDIWEIHPDDYALEVVIDDELEHDYESGLKVLKLEITVKKPSPRPV